MKNSSLPTILLGLLTVSALASVLVCWLYISNTRQLRALQAAVASINTDRTVVNALLQKSEEWGKTHPDIIPVLDSMRGGKAASAPAPSLAPSKPSK